MKTKVLVLSVLLVATPLPAPAAHDDEDTRPVAVDTSHFTPHLQGRIESAAEGGIVSLTRFLDRTRKIYGLRLSDVLRQDTRSPGALAATRTDTPAATPEPRTEVAQAESPR
jgi:hypothetical protein